MSWFNPKKLIDKLPKFKFWSRKPKDPNEEAKPYVKYSRGPRDTGPTNLPPWPELAQVAIALSAVALGGLLVGLNQSQWMGDDIFIAGPAIMMIFVGFMVAFCGFVADSYDRAKARGEYDEDNVG